MALGILLSSLGRYWLFMVSGSWGTWTDEVRAEQLLDLPLRLEAQHPATARVIAAVDELPDASRGATRLADPHLSADVQSVLSSLDEAVADLFDLTEAERDAIRDFWAAQCLDATHPVASTGAVLVGRERDGGMSKYVAVFMRAWLPLLGDSARLEGSLGPIQVRT